MFYAVRNVVFCFFLFIYVVFPVVLFASDYVCPCDCSAIYYTGNYLYVYCPDTGWVLDDNVQVFREDITTNDTLDPVEGETSSDNVLFSLAGIIAGGMIATAFIKQI